MTAQRSQRTATKRDASVETTRRTSEAARPPMPRPTQPRPPASRPSTPQSDRPSAIDRVRTAAPRVTTEGRGEGLRRLYRDTVAEMKKIVWPDRETTKNLTLVVIGISVVLGVLLGGIDFLLQALFETLP